MDDLAKSSVLSLIYAFNAFISLPGKTKICIVSWGTVSWLPAGRGTGAVESGVRCQVLS